MDMTTEAGKPTDANTVRAGGTLALSVIIPTFNGMPWLPEAVESVLEEMRRLDVEKSQIELIVIDDGSTDETQNWIAGFSKTAGSWVRFHRFDKNIGRSAARNHGASIAKGTLITFLDSDDLFVPGFCKGVIERFSADPTLEVLCALPVFVDGSRTVIRKYNLGMAEPEALVLSAESFLPSGLTLRGSTWRDTGGFDESLHEREDWDLGIRLVQKNCRIKIDSELTAQIRVHSANNSRNHIRYCRATLTVAERSLRAASAVGRKTVIPDICMNVAKTFLYRDSPFVFKIHAAKYLALALLLGATQGKIPTGFFSGFLRLLIPRTAVRLTKRLMGL